MSRREPGEPLPPWVNSVAAIRELDDDPPYRLFDDADDNDRPFRSGRRSGWPGWAFWPKNQVSHPPRSVVEKSSFWPKNSTHLSEI